MYRIACVLLAVGFTVGCGRSDLPELGTVTGVVTASGAPVANAIVNFTPTGPGRPSTGETDAQGKFKMIYLQGIDGAIVGEHTVTVERVTTEAMDDLPDDPSEMTAEQKAAAEAIKPLPPAASDGSVKVEVKAGTNELNITL
ncbi:MAG: carboxypeptidase-like regulatory domain-containing protein [Planctomycetaceae bacterium]